MRKRQPSSCKSLRKHGRTCPSCKINPALNYSSYCRPCATKNQVAYLKRRGHEPTKRFRRTVREFIKTAKDRPCVDCGFKYPWYVMDFDHCRGTKKFNLSVATSHVRSTATIQAEIDKCDVVCANCHRSRTFRRRQHDKNNQ